MASGNVRSVATRASAAGTSPLSLLHRPQAERVREHKYRFGQAVVFGLPVLALQIWGPVLGGPESPRWIGVLQGLLAGWVTWVAAAGMASEGLIRLMLRRKVAADLVVAALAIGLYLAGVVAAVIAIAKPGRSPTVLFSMTVVILGAWVGVSWWRLRSQKLLKPGDVSPEGAKAS